MIKSIATQPAKPKIKDFLNEFGIKDKESFSQKLHEFLMADKFYWVDEEDNQGYYVDDDPGMRRTLTKVEQEIYEYLYFDATAY